MIALALAALVAAVAANVALVPFVAARLSPTSGAPVSTGVLLAGNENYAAAAKLAA